MSNPTKTHLTAELEEFRAAFNELRHFLLPEALRVLNDPFRCRPIPGCNLAEKLTAWKDARILPAEDRAGLPEHPIAKVSRRERTNSAGTSFPEFHYSRSDGQPLEMCDCTNCGCGRIVYLLSVRRGNGTYFTARVNHDGFKHRCAEDS